MTSKVPLKQLLEQSDAMDLGDPLDPQNQDPLDPLDPLGSVDPQMDPPVAPGMCVECTDTPQQVECQTCDEAFCRLCFDHLHRTGKRRNHTFISLIREHDAPDGNNGQVKKIRPADGPDQPDQTTESMHEFQSEFSAIENTSDSKLPKFSLNTKFIPVRLTLVERKYFRLLQAALEVSEYTDKVDSWGSGSRTKRILAQIREMCTVLTGLVVANNMEEGQRLVADKDFASNKDWFRMVFEIGRRYKIMNPEKMRDSFGKLMYMIMDSRLPEISDTLEFDLYTPIKTVHSVLNHYDGLALLEDSLVPVATQQVVAGSRSRTEIQRDIRRKENAVERLAQKYSGKMSRETIRQLLYSISDYNSYVQANRVPVQEIAKRLTDNFSPEDPDGILGIVPGTGGARLSHSHSKQYQYVLQSLTLWSEIMRDMYMLWKLADDDMCSDTRYALGDTGQGMNRVKACPKVGRAMYNIINNAQQKTGNWIGSSVVHLGDRAVPNALFFLDKYLQVPRMLNPINLVLNRLDLFTGDKYIEPWINSQFGSVRGLEKTILVDFFRHAFDGSGADNFYDAGSCIDGRLTSAWNWANTLPKKPYHNFFLVAGFLGFDGSDGF